MNYFSAPMPFNFEFIDELADINNKVKESKITTLYNCLPYNAEDMCGFEHSRIVDNNINKTEDLLKYAKYTQDKGFEFIYLLNSALFYIDGDKDFKARLDKLNVLCEKLLKNNIYRIRISNLHLASYLTKKFPEFKLYTSILMEYSQLEQFSNLFSAIPKIKGVIPAESARKNFVLLKNLRKKFPNTEIEMMLNEGCVHNCPYRLSHCVSMPRNNFDKVDEIEFYEFFKNACNNMVQRDVWLHFCKSNLIFPWEINEYSKIGINNFKFAGRNHVKFVNGKYIKIYEAYIRGIEDPNYIDNLPIQLLSNNLAGFKSKKYYTVKEIKSYLPDIKYLMENTYKCASVCGSECTYCHQKAKILNKKFPIESI